MNMTSDEFLAWAKTQPRRYELYRGQAIEKMSPDAWRKLAEAIEKAGLSCQALTEGAIVRIDETTAYQPDAMVRCGPDLPGDAVEVTDPIIVVEVASPSTRIDSHLKLDDYFRLESVQHYLVVNPETGTIIHFRRDCHPQIIRDLPIGRFRLRLDQRFGKSPDFFEPMSEEELRSWEG